VPKGLRRTILHPVAAHTSLAKRGTGIEDLQTWDLLARPGCDLGQGYLIARPLPAPELTAWLADFERADPRARAA
jgi:EAL domain-containing protein (putative c-di-GMP-specific phosphodiesterase class I)